MYGIRSNLRRFILFSIVFVSFAYVQSSLACHIDKSFYLSAGHVNGVFNYNVLKANVLRSNDDAYYCNSQTYYCLIYTWKDANYFLVTPASCAPAGGDLTDIRDAITRLNQENANRMNENVSQDSSLTSLNQENAKRFSENVSQNTAISELQVANSQRFAENNAQTESINSLTARANALDSANAAQSKDIASLQTGATDIRAALTELYAENDAQDVTNNNQNTKITDLSNSLSTANTINTTQNAAIAGLTSNQQGMSRDVSTLTTNYAALAADLGALESDVTDLGTGIQGVQTRLDTANTIATGAANANVTGHANTAKALNDVNKSVKDLTSVVSSQTNETNRLLTETDKEVKQGLTDWWGEAASFTNDAVNSSVNSVLSSQGLGEGSFNLGQTIINVATLDNSGFLGSRPSTLPVLNIDLSSTALKYRDAIDLNKIKVVLDVLKVFLWIATWVMCVRIVLRTD